MNRRNDEELVQRAIWQHYLQRRNPRALMFHCPNGEARSKATGGRLKAMGVVAGVADFIGSTDNGTFFALELKAGAGKAYAAQEQFAKDCEAAGAVYAIAWGIDQALAILESLGIIHGETQ